MLHRILAMVLCMALLLGLAGCGTPADSSTRESAPTTEATVHAPTPPADGNPDDVTCQGTYYVSDTEVTGAKDTVVATMKDARLTNSQLQIGYWLEVAAHRASDHPEQPDYTQSLDTQPCPIDSSVNSWQQYFLRKALDSWHAQQALVLMSQEEGTPAEEAYNPDLERRAEYMTGMPVVDVLYQWSDSYQPNRLHQNYLDAIPETLDTLAADSGFGNTDAMAKAVAGAGADGSDLVSYTHTVNLAYMYFTEMGYHFTVSEEDVEAFLAENPASDPADDSKTVDIRHILLIPENAEVAADGTVTAGEDAWERCRIQAQSVVDRWKRAIKRTRYSQHTITSVPESRFSEIAKDYSQDTGSAANGGLYVHLKPGQLMSELDAWCFDAARQHGDYGIVRTDAGYHILFFCGNNENRYTDGETRLTRFLYHELVCNAMKKYPMEVSFDAIKLGTAEDNGSFITMDQLLYPDVAHERFPDMPLYLQQDYPDASYGNYKLSSHGCGITTMAMVASYLADDELTPVELASRYGYYCGERGTEIVLFDDTPAELGFHLKKRSYSWDEMDAALENGQVVVSLQWAGYWTRGGHYLAMIGLTDEGRYVVRDSNLFNYKRVQSHLQDSHTRGSIGDAGQYYWIYEKKVTSIPTCVRCGGSDEGAPEIMFRSAYHCEKCLTAMARRDDYLSSLAG